MNVSKTSFGLGWLIPIILWACSSDDEEPKASNAGPVRDREDDGVPDEEDDCPEVRAPRTGKGCPSPAFIPDASKGPNAPDKGVPLDDEIKPFDAEVLPDFGVPPPHLQSRETFYLLRESEVHCPSMAVGANKIWLNWQEGRDLFTTSLPLENIEQGPERILKFGESPNPNFTLCNIQRSVTVSEQGSVGLLWGEMENDNVIRLKFKTLDPAGHSSEGIEVASLFLHALGEDHLNSFASLTALPNGQFVVVWTDRDKVMGRIFSDAGEPATEKFLINRRALEVLNVINPDVAVTGENAFTVVWEEGDDPEGPIMAATMNTMGEKIGNDFLIAESGRLPTVASQGSAHLFGWVEGGHGGAALFSGETFERAGSFTFGEVGDLAREVTAPQVVLNEAKNLSLGWILKERRNNAFVQITEVGDPSQIQPDANDTGITLGETFNSDRMALAGRDSWVVAAYSLFEPNTTLAVQTFQWGE